MSVMALRVRHPVTGRHISFRGWQEWRSVQVERARCSECQGTGEIRVHLGTGRIGAALQVGPQFDPFSGVWILAEPAPCPRCTPTRPGWG